MVSKSISGEGEKVTTCQSRADFGNSGTSAADKRAVHQLRDYNKYQMFPFLPLPPSSNLSFLFFGAQLVRVPVEGDAVYAADK